MSIICDSAVPQERQEDCVNLVTHVLQSTSGGERIVSLTPTTGGLFNFLLRVETTERTLFFKQYLDGMPNTTFSPPAIPATDRASLAHDVQREAAAATANLGQVVPDILAFDPHRSAFVMEAAQGDEPLIEGISTGAVPALAYSVLPRALASLHRATYGKFESSSPYANTEFRDFKLRIQYDDIADRLERDEATVVRDVKAEYQNRTVCMTHGDPNSRNVMVGKGMGLVDFEQSHLGAPAYDLAYILCELYISKEFFGATPESNQVLHTFLDNYFAVFDAEERKVVEIETTPHLAVQAIYRFWGPSRASWTFYIPEERQAIIIDKARAMLSAGDTPVSLLID